MTNRLLADEFARLQRVRANARERDVAQRNRASTAIIRAVKAVSEMRRSVIELALRM